MCNYAITDNLNFYWLIDNKDLHILVCFLNNGVGGLLFLLAIDFNCEITRSEQVTIYFYNCALTNTRTLNKIINVILFFFRALN